MGCFFCLRDGGVKCTVLDQWVCLLCSKHTPKLAPMGHLKSAPHLENCIQHYKMVMSSPADVVKTEAATRAAQLIDLGVHTDRGAFWQIFTEEAPEATGEEGPGIVTKLLGKKVPTPPSHPPPSACLARGGDGTAKPPGAAKALARALAQRATDDDEWDGEEPSWDEAEDQERAQRPWKVSKAEHSHQVIRKTTTSTTTSTVEFS